MIYRGGPDMTAIDATHTLAELVTDHPPRPTNDTLQGSSGLIRDLRRCSDDSWPCTRPFGAATLRPTTDDRR